MHLAKGCRQFLLGQSAGFSLTELMVTIAIGSFIALAGTTFYVTTVGSGKDIFDSAKRTEQVYAPITSLSDDIRRAGFRGLPSALTAYLVTTQGSGASITGDEGDFPAVEFGTTGVPSAVGATTECVLVSYVRDHNCVSGDDSNFPACASVTVGDVVPLHHRFGYRLQSNVLEATVVVHPDEYASGAPAPSNSECNASGETSAWVPVTNLSDVFVDTFTVHLVDQDSADGDNGCVLGAVGTSPCDTYGSTSLADCGTTSLSCRIDRLYKITLCAYSENADGLCASNPENKIVTEIFAKPRNAVLIQKAAS
ncbi:MAG: prepilin-type N-terminal cleavage/methylation domain-containing protein [Luminiphilus sp.]|nr:prepilin-type N-terminal cleavage/methylation domain-containing protein [Luminiphilus sp.]